MMAGQRSNIKSILHAGLPSNNLVYTNVNKKLVFLGRCRVMRGTTLLINEDHTVTVLENISRDVYEVLACQDVTQELYCTIDDREVCFGSIAKVVWCENTIDWDYGY